MAAHRLRLSVPHRPGLRQGGAGALRHARRSDDPPDPADHAGRAGGPAGVRLRAAPIAVRAQLRRAAGDHPADDPAQPHAVARRSDHGADRSRSRPARAATIRRSLVQIAYVLLETQIHAADPGAGDLTWPARPPRPAVIQSTDAQRHRLRRGRQCGADAAAGAFPQRGDRWTRSLTGSPTITGGETITDRQRAPDPAGGLGLGRRPRRR